jgi:hypothetical protein
MSIKRMQELAGLDPKQTAVEWLIEEMSKYGYAHTFKLYQRQVEQAKEMEKEQITDAYYMGSQDAPIKGGQSEQYYNETFK